MGLPNRTLIRLLDAMYNGTPQTQQEKRMMCFRWPGQVLSSESETQNHLMMELFQNNKMPNLLITSCELDPFRDAQRNFANTLLNQTYCPLSQQTELLCLEGLPHGGEQLSYAVYKKKSVFEGMMGEVQRFVEKTSFQ